MLIEKAEPSIVIEVDPQTAKKITNKLKNPTIGMSFNFCDGQILVTDDIIGQRAFIKIC